MTGVEREREKLFVKREHLTMDTHKLDNICRQQRLLHILGEAYNTILSAVSGTMEACVMTQHTG